MNKKTLLIVDDEVDLREILADIFSECVDTVLTAKDGREALEIVKFDAGGSRIIDAVLSDINMPNMTGLEFLKELVKGKIDMPVVILTGFGDREKILEAMRYGAFDCQDKPFHRERLADSVLAAIDLGKSLKLIDIEVNELVSKVNITDPAELEKFRDKMRDMLKLSKERKAQFKIEN